MTTLIKNGTIVNDGKSFVGSILIKDDIIIQIYNAGDTLPKADIVIDAHNKFVIPGVIDDQVHFREPGATHKGDIESESAAAVLGGVTSYMDMPNNNPPATTIESLNRKNQIAQNRSYANYSFYLGATNENLNEILNIDPSQTCGVKIFMGSSTGNMLVDDRHSLENIFSKSPTLIATHCESEEIIKRNLALAVEKYGSSSIPFEEHSNIRSREACIASTKEAIELALKHNSRLHILHISTQEEIAIIREAKKCSSKISGEACVHYMVLNNTMYESLKSHIKCNPSIKEESDRVAIIDAVKEGVIDVVATDHAPHTLQEKSSHYLDAPSGLPLIQHSLQIMMEFVKSGVFTIEEVVERVSHAPARLFNIYNRGFLYNGYFADITILDSNLSDNLSTKKPAYRCGWSPFKDKIFSSTITDTVVNGIQVVSNGKLTGKKAGKKLVFKNGVQK